MSYIKDNLLKDETILLEARPSKIIMIVNAVICLVLLFTIYPVGFVLLFMLVANYIKYRTTEIAITNKRIIGRHGLFNKKSIEMKLDKVEAVITNTNMFGYGSICIRGIGGSTEVFKMMDKVDDFKQKFQEISHS